MIDWWIRICRNSKKKYNNFVSKNYADRLYPHCNCLNSLGHCAFYEATAIWKTRSTDQYKSAFEDQHNSETEVFRTNQNPALTNGGTIGRSPEILL